MTLSVPTLYLQKIVSAHFEIPSGKVLFHRLYVSTKGTDAMLREVECKIGGKLRSGAERAIVRSGKFCTGRRINWKVFLAAAFDAGLPESIHSQARKPR